MVRKLKASEMSALPGHVRALVTSGVYALYSIKGEALFALVTNAGEFYLLSIDGEIVHDPRYCTIDTTPLDAVVTFAEASEARLNRI